MKYVIMNREEAKELTGWQRNMDQDYHGIIPGLVCGYNFEVITKEGTKDFCSTTFEYLTPDEIMSGKHGWYPEFLTDMGLTPTGRVIFRGYYEEEYDLEERDVYFTPVDMSNVFKKYLVSERA